jgi:uncharacterized HAD superfamily protein
VVNRYGIDIDGVLADFPYACATTMSMAPEPISAENMTKLYSVPQTWEWAKPLVGEQNWKWFWTDGILLYRTFANARPIGQELHWLEQLPGEKFLITSRPHLARDQTYAWLGKHRVLVDGVLHVNNPAEKVEFLRDLKIDVFVDDHPDTIANMLGVAWMVPPPDLFLFAQPWNQHVQGVKRISSLRELL